MAYEYFFDKLAILKDRFESFYEHRKKLKALTNFSEGSKFPHRTYLTLVKKCLSDGFLGEKESDFLDHILSVYEMNWLDWAYRTKWVKEQIRKKSEAKPKPIQTTFDFAPKPIPVNIPLHILPGATNMNQVGIR